MLSDISAHSKSKLQIHLMFKVLLQSYWPVAELTISNTIGIQTAVRFFFKKGQVQRRVDPSMNQSMVSTWCSKNQLIAHCRRRIRSFTITSVYVMKPPSFTLWTLSVLSHNTLNIPYSYFFNPCSLSVSVDLRSSVIHAMIVLNSSVLKVIQKNKVTKFHLVPECDIIIEKY